MNHKNPQKSLIAVAVSMAALSMSAGINAAEVKADQEVTEIAPVVVTASRTEKSIYEAPASIALVDEKDFKEIQPQSIGEILDTVPNVTVFDYTNPIFSKMQIRGSDANQITYLIDGVRQDNYSYTGTRPNGFFIDPSMVKQVEVRRGGGSSLYGNGGIGGTVSLQTKSAADLLEDGKDFGATVKAGYSDANKEWTESAYLYGRQGLWDVVVGYTRRDGSEGKQSDTGKRSKAKYDSDADSFMAKAALNIADDNTVTVSYNYDRYEFDEGERVYRILENKQHRIAAAWEYTPSELVNIDARLQYTKADNVMKTNEYVGGVLNGIVPNYDDDFESISGNVQNTSNFEVAGMKHALTYGFDFSVTEQKSWDPVWNNADPTRPDSKGYDSGVFVQDDIVLNDYFSITPVMRYSYYKRESNAGLPDQDDSKFTPGVTLTFQPVDQISFYGSVNTGYRPPILDEMFYSMWKPDHVNTPIGPVSTPVVVKSNPDLKPEESVNYEIGMNLLMDSLLADGDRLNVKFAAFYDDVENMINPMFLGTDVSFGPSGMVMTDTWQTQNIGDAERKGMEISADYAVGAAQFQAAYGMVHAYNKQTDRRISGVTPQTFSLRAAYTLDAWNLTGWYRYRWNDETPKDSTVDHDAFDTHSVGLSWAPTIAGVTNLSADIALENLTNEKYTYGMSSTGWGRTVRASLTARF